MKSHWTDRSRSRNLRGSIIESAKLAQNLVPVLPPLLRCEQTIPHVAEKFDFHDVHFLYRDAGDLSPSLVGIGIVIEELIAKH
jgi:hypothetical protein